MALSPTTTRLDLQEHENDQLLFEKLHSKTREQSNTAWKCK